MNKMMKLTAYVAMVVFCSQFSMAVSSISWANNGNPLVYTNNVDIPSASTWVLRMYESANSTIHFAVGSPGVDTYTGIQNTWNSAGPDGYFTFEISNPGTFGLADNDWVYSVLFNADSVAAATLYCVLDDNGGGANQILPAGNGIWAYELMNNTSTLTPAGTAPGEWHDMIPEPATWAFMGIGFLTIAYRKLRKA